MKTTGTWIFILLLGLSGLYITAVGTIRLIFRPYPSAADIHALWVMERNVAHGRLPGFVSGDINYPYQTPAVLTNKYGLMATQYPPWAFFSGMLYAPPLPWTAVRWYSAILSLTALAGIMWWSAQLARPLGGAATTLCAVLPAAMFPVSYCLSNGQYAVFLVGLLVGCFMLADRGRDVAAGLLLGVALLKPHIAAPFALAFLVRGNWKLLATATLYNVVAIAAVWGMTRVDPLTLLRLSMGDIHYTMPITHSVLGLLAIHHGVQGNSLLLLTASVMIVGLTILYVAMRRGCRLLTLMSVAAVTSQLGMYRREYDTVVIVFLLINLAIVAIKSDSTLGWVAFVLVMASVCLPLRLRYHGLVAVQAAEAVAWAIGLIAVILLDHRVEPAVSEAVTHRVFPSNGPAISSVGAGNPPL